VAKKSESGPPAILLKKKIDLSGNRTEVQEQAATEALLALKDTL